MRLTAQPRPLTLAFSGGGAKCAAQAGVLALLAEARLPVKAIAGTSGGGLVALLYALGFPPEAILEQFATINLPEIWELDPDRRAIFGAEKIRARMKRVLGDKTFADLNMPVTLVAVDMHSGREVRLNGGLLVDAAQATMALPGVFAPLDKGGLLLVDGGVRNPLPVDVAYTLGRPVVAVDVFWHTVDQPVPFFETDGPMRYATGIIERLGVLNLVESVGRSVQLITMQVSEYNQRLYPPAVMLQPAVGAVSMLAFAASRRAYEAGVEATRLALPALEKLAWPTLTSQLSSAWRKLRRRPPLCYP